MLFIYMVIPKRIIIVPYRNRSEHKMEFLKRMKEYFKNQTDIEIYFAHQVDNRPFNRGAMKNIGFLAMKNKYSQDYKNITFIFHDVDTFPRYNDIIPYDTTEGTVSHYYGVYFALGGIVAIKGVDFEKIKGFPNFWGWGMEDNILQDRCIKNNIKIDRSCFYKMQDTRMVRLFDGFKRLTNKREAAIYKYEIPDNISHIQNTRWRINNNMINISNFNTQRKVNNSDFWNFDIRDKKMPVYRNYVRKNWSMFLK